MYRPQIKKSNEKKKQDSKKELGKFCLYYDTIVAPSKRKNKQNKIKSKKPYIESKFQKKFVFFLTLFLFNKFKKFR